MSKRKVRKLRHRTDQLPILTFKQLVEMGNVRAKMMRGEITPDQVPAWMMGEGKPDQAALENEFFTSEEHIHDENCKHDHE